MFFNLTFFFSYNIYKEASVRINIGILAIMAIVQSKFAAIIAAKRHFTTFGYRQISTINKAWFIGDIYLSKDNNAKYGYCLANFEHQT